MVSSMTSDQSVTRSKDDQETMKPTATTYRRGSGAAAAGSGYEHFCLGEALSFFAV